MEMEGWRMATSFPSSTRSGTSDPVRRGMFTLRHKYADPLDEQRAITLMTTPMILAVVGLIAGVFLVILNPLLYPPEEVLPPLAATLGICFTVYLLVQSGRLLLASL